MEIEGGSFLRWAPDKGELLRDWGEENCYMPKQEQRMRNPTSRPKAGKERIAIIGRL
ncbi:MAG TPA: hypothetical protein PLQ49_06675 [Methanothrix sp.]|nr:hypothetical protein [Methanothrix sp.]HRW82066.1 hypothetical protein [Methanothrix sp.]